MASLDPHDRLDLILPSAMRDNNVDMWIHAARQGNPDPLAYEFGRIGGFIIFTDLAIGSNEQSSVRSLVEGAPSKTSTSLDRWRFHALSPATTTATWILRSTMS